MKSDGAIAGTDLDPGLWSGKRRTRRVRRVLTVTCKGVKPDAYSGRTLDVSRGGMLLGLPCAFFRCVTDASSLVELTACVSSEFPNGIEATFLGGSVRARAEVVRVVLDGKSSAYPLLVGCRFEPVLTELECAALGIPISVDETNPDGPKLAEESNDHVPAPELRAVAAKALEAVEPPPRPVVGPAARPAPQRKRVEVGAAPPKAHPAAPPLPLVETRLGSPTRPPSTSLNAHLFSVAPAGGPRFSGPVASLDRLDATVLLTAPAGESDPVGWAAGLGMEVRAILLEDGAMRGEVRARVRRLDPTGQGQVRVTLLLAEALPAT